MAWRARDRRPRSAGIPGGGRSCDWSTSMGCWGPARAHRRSSPATPIPAAPASVTPAGRSSSPARPPWWLWCRSGPAPPALAPAAPTASTRRTTWPSWRPSASPPEGGVATAWSGFRPGRRRPSRPDSEDMPPSADQSGGPKGGGSGPVLGGEVLVLHLPRMVEGVEARVSDEEWQRPRPHAPLDLPGVVRAHRRDVGLPMLPQSIRGKRRALRYPQPHLFREVLAFGADGVADDLVAVASSPARALAHLRRDPRRDAVEERPAGPQERDRALELRLVHRLLLGRRGREGDAPEVGRTGSDLVLHNLEGPGGVELACHPGETRDRPVARPIGLERLQGELGALRAPTPPWPVDAEGHRPLPLGPTFDDGADRHCALLHGGLTLLRPAAAPRRG